MPLVSYDSDAENNNFGAIERALQLASPGEWRSAPLKKFSGRIHAFLVQRRAKKESQWSRTDLKQNSGEIFEKLENSGPQVIANAKEHGKERAILLLESEMNALLEALTELSKPKYATGIELFHDLAHEDPASKISVTPRKKTFQNRRSLNQALSVVPE